MCQGETTFPPRDAERVRLLYKLFVPTIMAKKTKRRKKKPDSDLQFLGVAALAVAVVVLLWQGMDAFIWYGTPAVIGIALLHEAYK